MYSSPLKPRVDDLQGFPVYDEPVVASHTIDSALSRALKRTTRQNSFQNPKLLRRASPSTFVRSELLRRFIRSTFSVPSFSVQPSFVPIQIPSLISHSSFRFVLRLQPSSFKLQIRSLISTFRFVLLRFVNLQLQSSKSSDDAFHVQWFTVMMLFMFKHGQYLLGGTLPDHKFLFLGAGEVRMYEKFSENLILGSILPSPSLRQKKGDSKLM
ncbi:hypothetical protein P8452_51284 [Trifolium repens]|nr:hypothetical protein P8452_51284 [Trifolium repens]